jgi:hypothetical protein
MDIIKQRAEHYGSGDENLTRISELWSAYTGAQLSAHDVCWMMVLLKASRAKVDGGQHLDNFIDAHGYLELAERLR